LGINFFSHIVRIIYDGLLSIFVSDIAIFVLKRDVKLQLTTEYLGIFVSHCLCELLWQLC